MLALSSAALSFAPSVVPAHAPRAVVKMEEGAAAPAPASRSSPADDLVDLAKACNPIVGMYDPLGIAKAAKEGDTEEATIGWFRHAEIKHGRVAMAAFVGFCVQSNGINFPWAISGGTFGGEIVKFSDIAAAGGPGDQWDALPAWGKMQIIGAVGILEMIGEYSPVLEANGEKHYVKGGKPGYYPPFAGYFNDELWPHPLPLNLFDPFGFTKKMTPEKKAKSLVAEINNGRLAMIGIMGMLSASKGLVVPGLDTLGITPYSGEYMGPFVAADAGTFLGIQEMLDAAPKF